MGASGHDSSGTDSHSRLLGGSSGNDHDLNRLRARSCTEEIGGHKRLRALAGQGLLEFEGSRGDDLSGRTAGATVVQRRLGLMVLPGWEHGMMVSPGEHGTTRGAGSTLVGVGDDSFSEATGADG